MGPRVAEVEPQGSLITVNKDTGAGTLVGTLVTGEPAADLTFRGGTLFGWLEGGLKDLATIDKPPAWRQSWATPG